MKAGAFPGSAVAGAPVLCLDAQAYARRLFPADGTAWFETPALLASSRQAMQSLRPDWWLLPLLGWAQAWWQAHGAAEAAGARPLRRLKSRLADEGLRAALRDALRALGATGTAIALALQIEGPEAWLAWAGEPGEIDEGDAEDAVVYLAGLLHALAGSGPAAIVLREHPAAAADPAQRYAALTNAAAHHGWACVLCSAAAQALPEGFDALATKTPAAGQGAWLQDEDWAGSARVPAPFIVATVPERAGAEAVLARIAQWRARP